VEHLINVFNDAKNYGSILEVKVVDFYAIERRIEEIKNGETINIFEWQYKNIILEKIPFLIKQAKIMSKKYDVVCTNPPYMGNRSMNEKLVKYVNKNYTIAKKDLFAVFIEMTKQYSNNMGYISMITQHSWMFLSTFEQLKKEYN